jgi:hypothetical protein
MLIDGFGLQDTTPEVQERLYELLLQKTPVERVLIVSDRMEFTGTLCRATDHLRGASSGGPLPPSDNQIL